LRPKVSYRLVSACHVVLPEGVWLLGQVDWALAGLAGAPEPLEDRLFDAVIAVRAGGLFRLSADLRRRSEDVRCRRERDTEFAALETLRVAARAFPLVEATRRSSADPSLRGRARDAVDSIGDLALVGCGFEIWKTPTPLAQGAALQNPRWSAV